jgi:membrane protein required for colicin V production
LVAWVAAFWVALTFADLVAPHLHFAADSEVVRMIAAFVALFVLTLVALAIVNFLIAKLVEQTGLTGTDRAVGMLFGLARGFVLVAAALLVATLAGLEDSSWWAGSKFIGQFSPLVEWMHGWLPQEIGEV